MRRVWDAMGLGAVAAAFGVAATLAAASDLAGCFSVEGPAGPRVATIRATGDGWRGDFTSAAGMRRGVALEPDLYSTRVMLEANGRFMAVRQTFAVTASLTSRTDILAAVATPLIPPDRPDWAPAPYLYWALDDDLLAAWKVPCPAE